MDEEEWVYAWEEDLADEDGQLWVITMLSVLVMPFYESFHLSPILFPNLLEEISKQQSPYQRLLPFFIRCWRVFSFKYQSKKQ